MRVAKSLSFKKFLIMPPAFYKYEDNDVINFYTKLIEAIPESEIILYNFEKLCGYKFSVACVEKLAKRFPDQIIGVKDSSYNLFEKLKLDKFSILPGSESKLLKGLELGCSGIITATCNVTSALARKVYDDFFDKKEQSVNQKLCDVRNEFEKYNLISGLHAYYSKNDLIYKNVLPPLSILNSKEEKELIDSLEKLNFSIKTKLVA
jgi:4-hydroxy-tetrahydrodipicolinate synthase